jgi:hypothetical protein
VAITILSTILLPIGMYLIEYLKGSTELGNSHQVMAILAEKMEGLLSQPYSFIPAGTTAGKRIMHDEIEVIDLRPMDVGPSMVAFTLQVELVPVEFTAIGDPSNGTLERAKLDEGMKRLTLKAAWGKKNEHFFDLVAFKADL